MEVQKLRESLVAVKSELASITQEAAQRRRHDVEAWEEEAPALKAFADTLTAARTLMRKEAETVRAKMLAAMKSTGHVEGVTRKVSGSSAKGSIMDEKTPIALLKAEITRLIELLGSIDDQLGATRVNFANETRLDGKELWEAQLVALQDTRNLTNSELERLRVALVNHQRALAYAQHKESGAMKIAQLQEEISSTETKLNRAKQLLHFPPVHGYRFRTGGRGVFLAATDLFVSELEATFSVSCQRVYGADGRPKVLAMLKLGGPTPKMTFADRTSRTTSVPSDFRVNTQSRPPAPSATPDSSQRPSSANGGLSEAASAGQSFGETDLFGSPPARFAVAAEQLQPASRGSDSPIDAPSQGVWYNNASPTLPADLPYSPPAPADALPPQPPVAGGQPVCEGRQADETSVAGGQDDFDTSSEQASDAGTRDAELASSAPAAGNEAAGGGGMAELLALTGVDAPAAGIPALAPAIDGAAAEAPVEADAPPQQAARAPAEPPRSVRMIRSSFSGGQPSAGPQTAEPAGHADAPESGAPDPQPSTFDPLQSLVSADAPQPDGRDIPRAGAPAAAVDLAHTSLGIPGSRGSEDWSSRAAVGDWPPDDRVRGAAEAARRAPPKQSAGESVAALKDTRSKGKRMAMGLINRIANTKKFGKKGARAPDTGGSPDDSASPSAVTPTASDMSSDNMHRSAILQKMRAANDSATQHASKASFREKMSAASKMGADGLGRFGAFVKTSAKSAAAMARQPGLASRTSANDVGDLRDVRLSRDALAAHLAAIKEDVAAGPSPRATDACAGGEAAGSSPRGSTGGGRPLTRLDMKEPVAGEVSLDDVLPRDARGVRRSDSAATAPPPPVPPLDEEDGAPASPVKILSEADLSLVGGEGGDVDTELGAGLGDDGLPEWPRTRSTADTPRLQSATSDSASNLDGVEGASDRRGVYIVVKATGVKIIGEKGTKVPNLNIKDLHIMVDCVLEAHFEYTEVDMWQPSPNFKLDIVQLEHTISGTPVPVPKALLKYILNLVLPTVIQNKLRAVLPIELGQYFLKQTAPGVQVGGKMVVIGPQMTALDADLTIRPDAGTATKKQARKVAASFSARSMLGLSLAQCHALSDLFCSKQLCVLPVPLERLTFAGLSTMHAHVAQHQDLLQRWLRATAFAVEQLFRFRKMGSFDWLEFSTNVLQPAARKPLRVRFLLTCCNLSLNVDEAVTSVHEYFTRAAQTEAQRDGGATLPAQLDSLNEFHAWLFAKLQAFKRRFKRAKASVLGTVDPKTFSLFLEEVLYQGPIRLEIPMDTTVHSDGSLSFGLKVPATLANRRSVVNDMLRTLIDSQTDADDRYLHDAELASGAVGGVPPPPEDPKAPPQIHPLLGGGPDVVAKEGEKLALGNVQVNALALKMVLEEDLMQEMLKGALTGSITPDSLARMLQCFGPCFHVGVSDRAILTHDRALDGGNRSAGLIIRTGEVCNALLSAESIGYASSVSPLRMVRFFHTGLVSAAVQGKATVPPTVARLDRLFHTLARYVGSESLDVSISLQFAGKLLDGHLHVQLLGRAPSTLDDASSCCISFSNDVDMQTILESIDIGQGQTPLGRQ